MPNITPNTNLPSPDHDSRMSDVKSALLGKSSSDKPKFLWDKDKLTPTLHLAITTAIRNGATLSSACKLSGISPISVKKWLRAVDNGGIDPTTGFHATGAHYQLYKDIMISEATNEDETISMIRKLGHGMVENETDVIERTITEPNGNVVTERIVKKAVIPPNFNALSWFASRRHRDWSDKRQIRPGMEAINQDNASEVISENEAGNNAIGSNMPPLVIQVSNSANVVSNIPASAAQAQGLPINIPRDVQFHGAGRISTHPLPGASAVPGMGLSDRIVDTNFNLPMSGTASDGHLTQGKFNKQDNSNSNLVANEHARSAGEVSINKDEVKVKPEGERNRELDSTQPSRSTSDALSLLLAKRRANATNKKD